MEQPAPRRSRTLGMVSPRAKLALGSLVTAAVALMAAAVWLWLHNVIIVAAPVAFLAAGCAWAGVDNALIYPKERARRQGAQLPEPPTAADEPATPAASDSREITAPH